MEYDMITDHKFIKVDNNHFIAVNKVGNRYGSYDNQERWHIVTWDECKETKATPLKNKIILTKEEIEDIAEQLEKLQTNYMWNQRIYKSKHRIFKEGEFLKFFQKGIRQAQTVEKLKELNLPVVLYAEPTERWTYNNYNTYINILNNKVKVEHTIYLKKAIKEIKEKIKEVAEDTYNKNMYQFKIDFPKYLSKNYITAVKREHKIIREHQKRQTEQLSLL